MSMTSIKTTTDCLLCPQFIVADESNLLCDKCESLDRYSLFENILCNLHKSASNGFDRLYNECERVQPLISIHRLNYSPITYFDHLKHDIDRTSQSYMETYCDSNFFQNFIPIHIPIRDDNENSFYNSLAYLSNFENDIVIELKVKNICELVLNYDFYQELYKEDFEIKYHIIRQLRYDHKQTTILDFMGIASVLNIAIQSVFPNVNEDNDQTTKNLNKIFFPRNSNRQEVIQITLLWTNNLPLNQTNQKMLWRSDRIIPLLKLHELKSDLDVVRLLHDRPQARGVFYTACPCGCEITQSVLNQIVPKDVRRQREFDLYHRRKPKHSSMKQSCAQWPLSYVIGKSKLSIGIKAIIQLLHDVASTAQGRKQMNPIHDSNQLLMYTFDNKLLEPAIIPLCDAVDANNFVDKVENIRCSKSSIGTAVYDAIDQILDKLEQQPSSNYNLFVITDNCDTESSNESKKKLSNIKFKRSELNARLLYVKYGDIQGNSENTEDDTLAKDADVRIYLNDNDEQVRRTMKTGYSKVYEDGATITSCHQQSNIAYDRDDRIPYPSRIYSSNTQQHLVNSTRETDQTGQNFQSTMQYQVQPCTNSSSANLSNSVSLSDNHTQSFVLATRHRKL
ncbi:unnamed protein product [Didymodactylos carnosus]|uniref:Uncharacterized protein n=1 Tax=Didymodactylos carnosus TaxID=1234261 RepID=A0A815H513_9BILA|nr:unnamed protein product [Didymodactylos carnosus]CAF1347589.1 unnamed protein product [Didymodactylos carnosus]CAF3946452.1 unnamed protein product [Didymodactylos carnosus]CAF4214711.1 unnamed protein product [Didymodactylos carnosus]